MIEMLRRSIKAQEEALREGIEHMNRLRALIIQQEAINLRRIEALEQYKEKLERALERE